MASPERYKPGKIHPSAKLLQRRATSQPSALNLEILHTSSQRQHPAGGITSKVASTTRWHHQQGGITSKVASSDKYKPGNIHPSVKFLQRTATSQPNAKNLEILHKSQRQHPAGGITSKVASSEKYKPGNIHPSAKLLQPIAISQPYAKNLEMLHKSIQRQPPATGITSREIQTREHPP